MDQRLVLGSLSLFALTVGLVISAPVDTNQAALQVLLNSENCSENLLDCLGGPVSEGGVRVLK